MEKFYEYIILDKHAMMSSIEESSNKIPMLTIHAGPKSDEAEWKARLK